MHMSMLPDAVQRERESLLQGSVSILRQKGAAKLAVHDLPGFDDPPEIIIPVLNVPMQPDIWGTAEDESSPVLGVVEVSSDLSEDDCGRRWQAFSSWARDHNASVAVFVHPEDEKRAEQIARQWHVEGLDIVPVPRAPH